MNGEFAKVSSSYISNNTSKYFREKLPVVELKKLGRFTLVGNSQLSATAIDADLQ
jgi:hypothetical protein